MHSACNAPARADMLFKGLPSLVGHDAMAAVAMCPRFRAREAATASAVLAIEQVNRSKNAHWHAYNKVVSMRFERLAPVREGTSCGCECGNGADCVQRLGTKRPRSRLTINAAGEEVWRSPPLLRSRPAHRAARVDRGCSVVRGESAAWMGGGMWCQCPGAACGAYLHAVESSGTLRDLKAATGRVCHFSCREASGDLARPSTCFACI